MLKSKRSLGPLEQAEYLISLFRLMWRYHFFFESPTYLSATDEKIALSRERIRNLAQSASVQRIHDAMMAGDIPTVEAPTTPKILAEHMWAVWGNRLSIARPGSHTHDAGELVIYDCCLHHISLIHGGVARCARRCGVNWPIAASPRPAKVALTVPLPASVHFSNFSGSAKTVSVLPGPTFGISAAAHFTVISIDEPAPLATARY